MDMFKKHIDYDDLSAFEASSMAIVAVLAIVNGVVLGLGVIGTSVIA